MTDSPQKKHPSPPYATFAPFIGFLNKLRETNIPGRIDPSVFGNVSGSVSYSVIAALKSMKLIEPNGLPTPEFTALVNASDEDRRPLLKKAMMHSYPTLHSKNFPLTNATASQFDEHIRENYDAKGSTVDKVASFFIAAADYAGIGVSDLIKARKSSAPTLRLKRKRSENAQGAITEVPKQKDATQQGISNLALEYKLVDLMREDDVDTTERDAIWVLLQYLTKKRKTAVDQP